MLSRYFSVLVCSVFVASAARSQAADDPGADIRSVIALQMAAWNQGDIRGYMQGYWKSDSLLFTSAGQIERGWEATYEKYRKAYDSKSKMGKLEFSDIQVNMLSPDAAWVIGHWGLVREKDHPRGVFTLVFRKWADGWKIVHDHTSLSK